MLREVRLALEKRHPDKMASRQKVRAEITKPYPGVSVRPGDLVRVKETSDNLHRYDNSGTLEYE